MSAPASGTSPSWKQRARLVIGLARWDAAATLSSRWLWMARYCVPGLFVTAFAAFILFETWDPKVDASTRESAEVLGKTLIHAAFAFAAIGIPWLVYMRFTEARRTGMLEALILSPMSRIGGFSIRSLDACGPERIACSRQRPPSRSRRSSEATRAVS